MKRFEPSRTYSSPSRRAVVRIAALSEPEPDSVSAYAGSHSPLAKSGRYFSFCSSEPAILSPSEPSSCTARMSADVAQTFPTSSIAMSERSVPVPRPPYCSSKKSPKMSFSRKSSTTSHGNSCDSSISAARGAMRSRASWRTRSRSSRCSSLRTSQAIAGSLFGRVADGLDVVAIGVEDERAVVILVIPAQSRRAVVRSACGDRGGVERVDGGAVDCRERHVHSRRVGLALVDPERRALLAQPAHAVLGPVGEDRPPERRERLLVESTAERVVAHVGADMVEHRGHLLDGAHPVVAGVVLELGETELLEQR